MEHPALGYRAGVTATLACFRGNAAVLEAIALETITEGKPWKWIERLGLMDGPLPHSTSRSLYIIWDTVDTLAHPMLSIEERLSIRDRDTGEGDGWKARKGTMGETLLSPSSIRGKGTDRGDKKNNPRIGMDTIGELEGRGRPEPSQTGSMGPLAPSRTPWTDGMEDSLGDWPKSPEVRNKDPWLIWRDRTDLTTSTRSEGLSSAIKRSQQDEDSGIKAMKLDDHPLSSMPRDQMEALTMADRLGGTAIDSASGSTRSSRPDWETVLTHKSMGRSGPGRSKPWRRDLSINGPGIRPRENRSMKRKSNTRAVSGRKGSMDEEVLMVVESQADRLSELDSRNKSIISENSEIKSVLLRNKEYGGHAQSNGTDG